MGFNILFSVLTCCITCFCGRCRQACHVCVIYDHCLWEPGLLITRQWRCRGNWNVIGCNVLSGGDPYWIRLLNIFNLERNGKGFGQSLWFLVVFKACYQFGFVERNMTESIQCNSTHIFYAFFCAISSINQLGSWKSKPAIPAFHIPLTWIGNVQIVKKIFFF